MDARTVLNNEISEKAFQQQIIDLARMCGWLAYHTHDSRRSAPGFPDLVLAKPGNQHEGYYPIVFLEVKTSTGRVRPEQRAWLEALDVDPALGDFVVARVVRPADWPMIEALLTGRDWRKDAA